MAALLRAGQQARRIIIRDDRFDGSSIRGWKAINESDMLIVRIRRRRSWIRFARQTLSFICDVFDPSRRSNTAAVPWHRAQGRGIPEVRDSPTLHTSVRKLNSSSSTASGSTPTSIAAITSSIRSKDGGTPAVTRPELGYKRGTRRGTSPCADGPAPGFAQRNDRQSDRRRTGHRGAAP